MSTPDTMDTIDEAEQAWREYYIERQNLQHFVIYYLFIIYRVSSCTSFIEKIYYILDVQLQIINQCYMYRNKKAESFNRSFFNNKSFNNICINFFCYNIFLQMKITEKN